MRSIERYHVHMFEIAEGCQDPGETLVTLAVSTAKYCRQNPGEALAMTLYSHSRLMAAVPDRLRDEAAHINDQVFELLGNLAMERFPKLTTDPRLVPFVFTSVVGLCYGLLRPYIIQQLSIPPWLDDVIRDSCRAALATGDTWNTHQKN